jgi:hypothetical protein
MGAPDSVTLLTALDGGLLAKRTSRPAGGGPPETQAFGRAKYFRIDEIEIADLFEAHDLIQRVAGMRQVGMVRGRPVEGINRQRARRLSRPRTENGAIVPKTFAPAARHLVVIDVDNLPSPPWLDVLDDPDHAVEFAVDYLPAEFHGATVVWQFTSSQEIKPGLYLRLFFWSDRPVSDSESKALFRGRPAVDLKIYRPAQPIYTATPIFEGMPDPVPYRIGLWRGDRDEVTLPILVERSQAQPPDGACSSFSGEPGRLYAEHRADIGDHEGGRGFHGPIGSAIYRFFYDHGANADARWLRSDLEDAVRSAQRDPAKHDDAYVERRVADLDPWIEWTREREQEKAAAQPEPAFEPPPEDDTLDEARAKLALEMQRFAATSFAYVESTAALKGEAEARGEFETYKAPMPPVCGTNAVVGLGKTRSWREQVAAAFVKRGLHPVLAVPRHRLGDEIVRDFANAGIVARDFRGREYPDPEQPGKAMCHDLERIKAIEEAGGDISRHACRSKAGQCAFYNTCGYQKQRRQRPDVWAMPHQLLTRPKPTFIKCDTLGIDESFWSVARHGTEHRITLELSALIIGDRSVPRGYKGDGPFNPTDTANLIAISRAVHDVIMAEADGQLRRAELTTALHSVRVPLDDLRAAFRLEWARKIKLDLIPGMPPAAVAALCKRVAAHNRQVAKLARFWRLLAETITGDAARSPWLDRRHETNRTVEPAIHMAWCDEIHETWRGVPTMVMDATMPTGIVQRFYPGMAEPVQITAPVPHVYVRQITDQAMSKNMLIPTGDPDTPRNRTRRANVERLRRFIEVRAFEAGGGKVAVICNKDLESLLKAGPLPGNVEVDHYNNVTGENRFSNVAVLILIGRPEAPPWVTELIARVLFAADIAEIAADADGRVNYPLVRRGIRLRDGKSVAVKGPRHPDPRVEEVRWAICEAGLIQAEGRPRGINRTAANPLQVDILTNVVLPILVDEVTTWDAIRPAAAEVMRARGAVPLNYAAMSAAYPDLFSSAGAAEQALRRAARAWDLGGLPGKGNPLQTVIENYLITVCRGFLVCQHRRRGSRGPSGRLLYDPERIDPQSWLIERLGDVIVQRVAAEPASRAAAARRCGWFLTDGPARLRPCGVEIDAGIQWCPEHIRHSASITGYGRSVSSVPIPFFGDDAAEAAD